jgi:predicted nuclease with TOPRIM domain
MNAFCTLIKSLREENADQDLHRASEMRELRADMSKLREDNQLLTSEVGALCSNIDALRKEIEVQEERRASKLVQLRTTTEVRVKTFL